MFKVNTAGVDLAKNVIQIHGVDSDGKVVVRRQLRRSQFLAFFEGRQGCLIGMEACSGAHHWARQLQEMGHEVRLMPPSYVKPYVNRNKTDAADAEAICEAVTRPSMRFRVVKRGGRKEMQLPDSASQTRRTDSALVKALARAFRWKRMLESGEYATIAELAEREGIASSYITRVLQLTLLAPDIVEAILDGKQGPEVTLKRLMEPFPVEWREQDQHLGQPSQRSRCCTLPKLAGCAGHG
jgi:transposase